MYDVINDHRGGYTVELRKYLYVECRGSIPSKVGFWVGLRMFLYVRTPNKLTNAISKTQLLGPKKGGSRQKYPECGPFFVFGVF